MVERLVPAIIPLTARLLISIQDYRDKPALSGGTCYFGPLQWPSLGLFYLPFTQRSLNTLVVEETAHRGRPHSDTMPSPHPLRQTQTIDYSSSLSNPARQLSNASTGSSIYSIYSNPFPPTRTSTVSSTTSSCQNYGGLGHKRGISEATGMSAANWADGSSRRNETSPSGGSKIMRTSLRPLPQPPSDSELNRRSHTPCRGSDLSSEYGKCLMDGGSNSPSSIVEKGDVRPQSMVLSRSDSIKRALPSAHRSEMRGQPYHLTHSPTIVTAPELEKLQKSSTSHLRTLSRLTENGSSTDFSLNAPAEEVTGLQGRRRLQKTGSVRANRGSGMKNKSVGYDWSDRNWMDKQRQFLQAYEYLCHIGEAKEWIEDIIQKPIPPIVQLEEALRDGVTLAEIVQALQPEAHIRIFRHPKLQFRHSDNIAIFFRYLAQMELPELFRFELIDLYEKKNIPKVIYCIHALSWLLYRKGIVQFRIGNLVGQLEFEHHELEEMQRGLDRAGISMPSFTGMGATFGAEPEPTPEPEPVESEEERIERELAGCESSIVDLQSQLRGAILRSKLGAVMQELWDAEEMLIDLQARIRGDWARQIAGYRLSMKRFAINLQSASRGFLLRKQRNARQQILKRQEKDIVVLQSLVRAWKSRDALQTLHIKARKEEHGLKTLQAAIRGHLQRTRGEFQAQQTQKAEGAVKNLQAMSRGYVLRSRISKDRQLLDQKSQLINDLQTFVRGNMARQHLAKLSQALVASSNSSSALQAITRGFLTRRDLRKTLQQLVEAGDAIRELQGFSRGWRLRRQIKLTKASLLIASTMLTELQAYIRGVLLRKSYHSDLNALHLENASITALQACARGCISRQKHEVFLSALQSHTPEIIELQALARAMLLRVDVGDLLSRLDESEPAVVEIQSAVRGSLLRARYKEKQQYFRENMEKVIKVQSFIRGRLQGEAYKSLTTGKNPPVGTIKGFVHLLNDSDFDFDEEIGK